MIYLFLAIWILAVLTVAFNAFKKVKLIDKCDVQTDKAEDSISHLTEKDADSMANISTQTKRSVAHHSESYELENVWGETMSPKDINLNEDQIVKIALLIVEKLVLDSEKRKTQYWLMSHSNQYSMNPRHIKASYQKTQNEILNN